MTQPWKLALLLLCGGACAAPRPAPAVPAPSAPAAAPQSAAAAPAPAPAAPAEPSPLEKQRAKMLAEHQLELERFTPELKAQAQALVDKRYPSARAALEAALKSPHRKPADVARDADRHPLQTLEFLGLKPTLSVLEYGPGDGWYTEILAPVLAKQGKLLATNPDPNGPPDQQSTFYGQRFKAFLETSPEVYGKVETVLIDGTHPALPEGTQVDMVLAFRELHGMVNNGTLDAWLAAFHGALKPRGVFGVEQHRAPAGADPIESAKRGYLPEAWLIEKVTAAGFKLAGKSEINANPKDTKDYADGVWTLPPSYRLGDQDRAKYAAIGESDRMTLKFVKVEQKAPKPATAAATP